MMMMMMMKRIKIIAFSEAILGMMLILLCFGQEVDEVDVLAPMEKKEQEALYTTIQGFVGKWWNGSNLYPDPCGWTPIQGVSCDLINGFWYVTTLNIGPIHDNSLSCAQNLEFKPHLFHLKHLKSLSFFNCFLSPHTIPIESWEKLSNTLESLEFRSNPGLSGTIPSTLGVLRNLQSLVLLENGIAGEIPPEIGRLKKLKRLVLAGNSLTGHIPNVFEDMNELLILDLSRNSLSGSLPLSLKSLTSLLKLDVSNNHFQGNKLKQMGYLRNLTLMDLRNNKFSGGLVSIPLQEMESLEEIVLSNNPMGGDMREVKWEKLGKLAVLELSNVGLKGEIPSESLSKLKRLRHLGLSGNKLTGEVSPKLETFLPCLNALYLSGNNLIGKLEFSQEFYAKMGRRFGAWDNPNLCYQVGERSKSHHDDVVPFGVKPCKQEGQIVA